MNSIFVFVPAFGWQLSTHTFLSCMGLTGALSRVGVGSGVAAMSHPDIADLRNMAISIWYETLPMHSHILFVDADMGFDPQVVLDMLSFGQPVVGAIYRKKCDDVQWAVSGFGLDETPAMHGPFVEVEGMGFGCTLIRRDAIDQMMKHNPSWVVSTENHSLRGLMPGVKSLLRVFDPIESDDGAGRVSEDISFCRRWREAGGKVWGAGHYAITHVGPKAYSTSYAEWANHQHQIKQQAAE